MAGFIPAIHVCGFARIEDVDGRNKSGHDAEYAGTDTIESLLVGSLRLAHPTNLRSCCDKKLSS